MSKKEQLTDKQKTQIQKNADRINRLTETNILGQYDASKPLRSMTELLTDLRHFAAWQHIDYDMADAEALITFRKEMETLSTSNK